MNNLTGEQRYELVKSMHPLCWRIAKRLVGGLGSQFIRDVFEAAELGAWEAASKYVPAGAKFMSYAWPRIHGSAVDYIRGHHLFVNDDAALNRASDRDSTREEQERHEETVARVQRELRRLPDRQKKMIELRFGLYGIPPMTLDECAPHVGCRTKQGSRYFERQAISRLRRNMGVAA